MKSPVRDEKGGQGIRREDPGLYPSPTPKRRGRQECKSSKPVCGTRGGCWYGVHEVAVLHRDDAAFLFQRQFGGNER